MRVAVVGGGISGLSAAFLLSQEHEVTLYEREERLGGHSVTETVSTPEGDVAVDMGFIVFNKRNYPHLTALFELLGVEVAESSMSFGASIDGGRIEYGTETLPCLLAQPSNLLRPEFYGMLADMALVGRRARPHLDAAPDVTLGDVLDDLGRSEWFKRHYLLAMGGAIWDTAPSSMLGFPARTFLRFFENHGLLSVNNHPQWYTVRGGSRRYVDALAGKVKGTVRTGSEVASVARAGDGVEVRTADGSSGTHDQAVFACHSDEALAAIDGPTAAEREIIGAVEFRTNRAVLHSDTAFMPRRKRAWSSWVYLSERSGDGVPQISLSYWMNNLQPLDTKAPMIVTVNPEREPEGSLVHCDRTFDHPLLDRKAIEAQGRMAEIQGRDRLWFCGAWTRHGFHEDGIASAVEVARAMGCKEPW